VILINTPHSSSTKKYVFTSKIPEAKVLAVSKSKI